MKIIDINKAMSICFKNNVKVYPVKALGGFKIEYQVSQKKPYAYDKTIDKTDVNSALAKTYIYLANEL